MVEAGMHAPPLSLPLPVDQPRCHSVTDGWRDTPRTPPPTHYPSPKGAVRRHQMCVCRCSIPEGRGSLVISPQLFCMRLLTNYKLPLWPEHAT